MNKLIGNEVLGELNGHAAGIIMKELVRRAIVAIRNQRQVFEVRGKMGLSGKMDDVLTSADKAAQAIYLRSLRECFPMWGIIAEEDSLVVPCTDGSGFFFTVDPLDGTKAFVRKQSHGVGTMISLSQGNVFLAAYVGDVNTQEVFGFRPGSNKVHRISEYSTSEVLEFKLQPLKDRYILLRDPERVYSPPSQNLIGGNFKSVLVDGGSIGTWLARLWKGEVGAALLPPSHETPWDANPINAISKRLGFVCLKPHYEGTRWEPYEPEPFQKRFTREHDTLIVHESNLKEVLLVSQSIGNNRLIFFAQVCYTLLYEIPYIFYTSALGV
jgi:fructose-1,6-bisphosphatase/inositol monophosphatase family enzyme